ncbi:MAG: hypothetical protein GX557_10465 [Chloroflexi bacterium]|nr:hypothetical protein [Chloroflexota bacterium]
MLTKYLEDLEQRIDQDVEAELEAEWRAFLEGRFTGDIFAPRRARLAPPTLEWPTVLVNDTLDSPEQMVLQQLSVCSVALAEGTGSVLNVRSNFGTGIMPSLFGAEVFVMERSLDTLPTTRPLPNPRVAVQGLIERGVPDQWQSLGAQALAMGRYYRDLFRAYPKIERAMHIYHPDMQGPMDICELLWGSSLFLAILDEPDLVKALLDLVTRTYIAYMDDWDAIVPLERDYSAHWGLLMKGTIMLRDDSAMNLSPDTFCEFIEPYNQRLLDYFGGGATHYCGRGDHWISRMPAMRGVYGVNLSQPHLNDMEKVYRHTVDRGIVLLGLQHKAADEALAQGRDLHGLVHCW